MSKQRKPPLRGRLARIEFLQNPACPLCGEVVPRGIAGYIVRDRRGRERGMHVVCFGRMREAKPP